MACPVLDTVFKFAHSPRGREFHLTVRFTYANFYEPPDRPGSTSSGSGGPTKLPYFPDHVVSYTIDQLPVLDHVPPRFFGQVSYTGESNTYDTTLQISEPPIGTLRATSSYLVMIADNPGPLKGSFVPSCDSLTIQESPLEVSGRITLQGNVQVTMNLTWSL